MEGNLKLGGLVPLLFIPNRYQVNKILYFFVIPLKKGIHLECRIGYSTKKQVDSHFRGNDK